jgi:hypothetical protein
VRHPMRTRQIGGPDAGSKAEVGIIRDGDGFLFGVERHDREHWAKDLLSRDAHLVAGIGVSGELHVHVCSFGTSTMT